MPARLRLSWGMKSLKLFLLPVLEFLGFGWQVIRYALIFVSAFFRQRASLGCEILAIRSQLTFYEESIRQKRQPRPRFNPAFRLLWVLLSRVWSGWKSAADLMKPKTVLKWHQHAFLKWWRWKSRRKGGRPTISQEMRGLIQRLSRENVLWSAETIHGHLVPRSHQRSARHSRHDDLEIPGRCRNARPSHLSQDRANHPGNLSSEARFPFPCLASHGRRRLARVRLGRVRKQPPRQILQAHRRRTPPTGERNQALGAHFPGDCPRARSLLRRNSHGITYPSSQPCKKSLPQTVGRVRSRRGASFLPRAASSGKNKNRNARGRSSSASTDRPRRRRTGQGASSRNSRQPSARKLRPRPALHLPRLAQEARLHRRGGPLARPRYRGQRRHLQPSRCHHSAPLGGPSSGRPHRHRHRGFATDAFRRLLLSGLSRLLQSRHVVSGSPHHSASVGRHEPGRNCS